jgi:hypothetical protein
MLYDLIVFFFFLLQGYIYKPVSALINGILKIVSPTALTMDPSMSVSLSTSLGKIKNGPVI